MKNKRLSKSLKYILASLFMFVFSITFTFNAYAAIYTKCYACRGTRVEYVNGIDRPCSVCGGLGGSYSGLPYQGGSQGGSSICPSCKGTGGGMYVTGSGNEIYKSCDKCGGTGKIGSLGGSTYDPDTVDTNEGLNSDQIAKKNRSIKIELDKDKYEEGEKITIRGKTNALSTVLFNYYETKFTITPVSYTDEDGNEIDIDDELPIYEESDYGDAPYIIWTSKIDDDNYGKHKYRITAELYYKDGTNLDNDECYVYVTRESPKPTFNININTDKEKYIEGDNVNITAKIDVEWKSKNSQNIDFSEYKTEFSLIGKNNINGKWSIYDNYEYGKNPEINWTAEGRNFPYYECEINAELFDDNGKSVASDKKTIFIYEKETETKKVEVSTETTTKATSTTVTETEKVEISTETTTETTSTTTTTTATAALNNPNNISNDTKNTGNSNGIKVVINGTAINLGDQQPEIVNGRILVPIRGVFENLGYTVDWEKSTKTVKLLNSLNNIDVTVGAPSFILNGRYCKFDVPAQIINGRTMIPFRAVLENTGCSVEWDSYTNTVIVDNYGSKGNDTSLEEALSKLEMASTLADDFLLQ